MAYATIDDMVLRFGSTEMVRVTTPADQEMDGIVADIANTALTSATAMMDSYIGRRYQVPMDPPPPVAIDICCDITRFRLATGDGKTVSEEVRQRHKDAMQWLSDISRGTVVLDLDEVAAGEESYAQVATRDDAPFGRGCF